MDCLLGLGTNQGNRKENLAYTIKLLSHSIKSMRVSSVYESEALLPEGAPKSWDIPYLNMVIFGKYENSPHSLIKLVKNIEEKVGRTPTKQKWAPRIIDIDILILSDLIVNNEKLKIPHPEMLKRKFVMIPAAEVAPNLQHPLTRSTIKEESNKVIEKYGK